jgi:hypothetical protein
MKELLDKMQAILENSEKISLRTRELETRIEKLAEAVKLQRVTWTIEGKHLDIEECLEMLRNKFISLP